MSYIDHSNLKAIANRENTLKLKSNRKFLFSAPFIKPCHRNEPDLTKCIAKVVTEIKPRLETGIPEMHIPPLNPLKLPAAGLDTGEAFKATFENIEIFGAHNFNMKKLELDLENNKAAITLHFPILRIRSVYTVTGRILILELNGYGKADGNFSEYFYI